MPGTSVIDIDLTRLDENIAILRRVIGPEVGLCCVVKADAYGLGALRIARRLQGLGVNMLAVYTAEQARELIRAGITCPILVMMPVREIARTDILYRSLISGRLHLVVHDFDHLESLAAISHRFGCDIPLHVEIDLGMSRGGCGDVDAPALVESIARSRRLSVAGLMTHFPDAESDQQGSERLLERFRSIIHRLQSTLPQHATVHAANSAAVARGPRFHLGMVRVGLAWAGYVAMNEGSRRPPSGDDPAPLAPRLPDGLRGIIRWSSRIVHTKWIEEGGTVGYGAVWTAGRATHVGLVPVGYADGYPLTLSNRAVVRICVGDRVIVAPVIGRVSMDQLTIDLTDVPAEAARLGAEVELIAYDESAPNNLIRLARTAESIPYAILCGLNPRIPRRYLTDRTSSRRSAEHLRIAPAESTESTDH